MQLKKTIDEASRTMLAADSKIGVLATLDDEGYPHLTFLSSIQADGGKGLSFGQFSAGLSKRFIVERPDVGFLALDAEKRFLSGLAAFTHTENTGELLDLYNKKPLFRYNSYMGFSKVYRMRLVGITQICRLPMPAIILGAILTRVKAAFYKCSACGALPLVGRRLFSELDSLKFLCFADEDGRLVIFPVVQASAAGTDRVVFTRFPFHNAFEAIPDGAKAAVLCVNLSMESVLVKGVYHPGRLDIERVYNSMPPKMEYIYPRADTMQPVTEF